MQNSLLASAPAHPFWGAVLGLAFPTPDPKPRPRPSPTPTPNPNPNQVLDLANERFANRGATQMSVR